MSVSTYTCMDPGFQQCEPHMRAMLKFGGNMIVAEFPSGGPGAKDLRGDDLRRGIRASVEKLKPIIAGAGELGVKLAIENHLNGLLEPPESLNMLVDATPEKHVGVSWMTESVRPSCGLSSVPPIHDTKRTIRTIGFCRRTKGRSPFRRLVRGAHS